jgi:addiction module RelB/DinJ family antitoxin
MKTVITVKTNSEIKRKAAKLAAELGLSLSDIVNVSLAQFVQTKSLHLGVSERPSPALQRAIARAEADLKSGKASPAFDNVEDVIKYLGI